MLHRTFRAALAALAFLALAPLAAADSLALFTPEPGAMPEVTPAAAQGAPFLTIRARHQRVGILQNDIRGVGLVNSDRIVIPSGTPVYFSAFSNGERSRHGWCGVVTERNGQRGYCMFTIAGEPDAELTPVPRHNASLYAPMQIEPYGRPITPPVVTDNEAAYALLPPITLTFALERWTSGSAIVVLHATIAGQSVKLEETRYPRRADGTAVIPQGPVNIVLTADGEGVRAEAQLAATGQPLPPAPAPPSL